MVKGSPGVTGVREISLYITGAAAVLTDAVQGFPWLDVPTVATGADLVAVSAHKFGGPQGVGALVVREGTVLEPLLRGGGQERERRSGTHNVAGIVALAGASATAAAWRTGAAARAGAAAATTGAAAADFCTGARHCSCSCGIVPGRNASMRSSVIVKPAYSSGARPSSLRPCTAIW